MLGNKNDVRQPVRPDRRQARRDATRAEIVDAAWELAREHGLAALSLRDIAGRVGMRAPSLYQYFDSKNAIYDAMFNQGMEDALASTCAPITSTSTREVLCELGRRIFDFAVSDPARAQLLFQRTLPGFEPSPESYAPSVAMFDFIQGVMREHGITDPDAMDLWTALGSGLINQQLANDPGGNRWGRLIDRSVDMYLAHVSTPTRATKAKTKKGTR